MITQTKSSYLFLRDGTTYVKIPLTDMHYIEADGNYSYVQTRNRRFSLKRSLAAIGDELDPSLFIRASRGIIVNFTQVESISFAEGKIVVGGEALKLGKAYHQDIRKRMPRL